MLLPIVLAAVLDLRLELVRESLTGTHYRYRQYVEGRAVVGGEVDVTVWRDGSRTEERYVAEAPLRTAALHSSSLTAVNVDGVLHWTHAEVEEIDSFRRVVRYVENGVVLREEPQFANASKPARVFDPNPVTKLNDASLQDQNNAASAVPPAAYSDVTLDRLNASGPIGGQYVQIVDVQNPAVAPADVAGSLIFDRSQSGFEDANAYFHIDRSQMYLQSLGYTGARAIAPYPVPVDVHAANGRDDSFFVADAIAGRGTLFFGDGGTDDGEDSDLLVHEYGHAIHEWISPGTFLGSFSSQGRAISEAFGDYWSFSAMYDASIASGRDPFCFADWDARCANDATSEQCGYPPGADCLRRVDSTKTIADYVNIDSSGTEHRNGEIWSSALREIFIALRQRLGAAAGKKLADTIVVESFFGAPPNPSFAGMARRMIGIDALLTGGANADMICAAMTRRGILSDCAVLPRGEVTLFQSDERGVPIPDNDTNGVTLSTTVTDTRPIERLQVDVAIRHPLRGDLRVVLIAPDGSETVLQNFSNDRARDINVIYGRDALPVGSLDQFRGRSAAGVWRLRVSDLRPADAGTVMSWSLLIQFAGDVAAASRPQGTTRQVIAAAGHVPGANGTDWRTDLRLFASSETTATVIFTPTNADGRTTFAAMHVRIAAQSVVALDDVVAVLGTSGIGQIEIDGDVIATSRTYTRDASGSYGQFIRPARAGFATAFLPRLDSTSGFRTNIGAAEFAGQSGTVRVQLFDERSGALISSNDYAIQPFSHFQVPAAGAPGMTATMEVIDGLARVIAYASVIDNSSGDATYFGAADSRSGVAPAIRSSGAFATQWRSDVWIGPISTLSYRGKGISVAGASVRSSDAISELFHENDSRGVLAGNNAVLRVYTTGPRGTYGQSVPLMPPDAGSHEILHIENTDEFRTNIGVVTGAGSGVALLIVLDSSGREISRNVVPLGPFSLEQFQLRQPVTNGRVHVEIVDGTAYAYASVVDNRSGDPLFVPAQ